ncbi:1-acylglycerol-3-phosphate O-acyltransferase [Nocardia carnea]|uniref:1-acylglycerol-3-phosphate O-acyltransferase n=1 Tax=Nocardia carnea TaxID=37328 RepID=UPI002454DB0F|nr:1-acylglycerol-3-phosphate O-acyltransferase [Nocardia carnea]
MSTPVTGAGESAASSDGDLAAFIAAIRSGPQGADIGAIFDLSAVADLRIKSARRFRGPDRELLKSLFEQLRHSGDSAGPELTERLVGHAAGRTPGELAALGDRIFARGWYDRLYPEIWRLIAEHRAAGHTVVLTGTATESQLRPAATALGITHVLGARPEVEAGRLTGRIAGTVPCGPDKHAAVTAFAATHDVDLARSYLYTGSGADLPLLAAAGAPVPVAPDAPLSAAAAGQGWTGPAVEPRTGPTTGDYLRTVLGFAALLGGALFGALSKAHTRNRRTMADALMRYGTRWPLRLCGIRLRITGAEYARSPRPAVFLFNHQSQFDVLIVPAVLGAGVTGVGKKELIRHPVFGPLMRFVGVTFIDRSDTDRAKASLAPVVHTLRDGLSVAIAPEGTRSYSPQPGRFKKGAFHIARQAGVPVIPVVIRNAAEIGRRDSMIARPGTVDIAILPPIDITARTPAELDREVAAVRQRYLDTLRDWPIGAV